MKRLFSAVTAIAALGFAAACGGASTPRDTTPADPTTDSGVTTETAPTASSDAASTDGTTPGPGTDRGGQTEEPRPPVVPGSPIKYNSDLLGTDPDTAQSAIQQNLDDLCGTPRRCGVSVVIKGKGHCVRSIGPNPVYPGKTITVQARLCETETTEESPSPSKPESGKPSETTSG